MQEQSDPTGCYDFASGLWELLHTNALEHIVNKAKYQIFQKR